MTAFEGDGSGAPALSEKNIRRYLSGAFPSLSRTGVFPSSRQCRAVIVGERRLSDHPLSSNLQLKCPPSPSSSPTLFIIISVLLPCSVRLSFCIYLSGVDPLLPVVIAHSGSPSRFQRVAIHYQLAPGFVLLLCQTYSDLPLNSSCQTKAPNSLLSSHNCNYEQINCDLMHRVVVAD